LGALIASQLSNPQPRAKAANGVTRYDQATVIPVGRVGLGKGRRTGTLPYADPAPRAPADGTSSAPAEVTPPGTCRPHPPAPAKITVALEARAGGLRADHRRAGRPGGLGHPAAPQPLIPRRAPALALPRPAPTPPTGLQEPTTAPTLSAPTSDTVPRAVSGVTNAPGPVTAQAPATAATTRTTEAFSTFGATTTTTQPLATAPTTAAPTTTAPTTTAAPMTTLATTTSTEPTTTGPTTSGAEATTTTEPAIP
jgi:hypothetical protein